jgi:hypothetical protein
LGRSLQIDVAVIDKAGRYHGLERGYAPGWKPVLLRFAPLR